MLKRLKDVTGPIAPVVIASLLTAGMISMHIGQDKASTAWWAILGSVLINIAVNTAMTKWNLASREVAAGDSEPS